MHPALPTHPRSHLIVLLLAVIPCVLLLSPTALPQKEPGHTVSPSFVIDTVLIIGNTTTRDYVIVNEMTIRPGTPVTAELLQYDRARIYSLGLFTLVDLSVDTLAGSRILTVVVSERWHYFPVPLFGFRDGEARKVYYGAGFLHNNFQGRNQKLFASAVFGYNPSVQLSFYEPLIDPVHRLSLSTAASFSRVRNKSEIEAEATGDFNELHYDFGVGLGKRFSLFESGSLSLNYQVMEVSLYRPGRTVSDTGIDRFFYTSAGYAYDSRDLREYASRGRYIGVSVTKYGLGTSDVNFFRFGADMRGYLPLSSRFTLAGRVTGSMASGGLIPTYARMYFGYGERIRGYFRDVLEGENLIGSSAELRFMLLPVIVFRLPTDLLPEQFTVWQFGVSLALFADAGTTWFRGDPLILRNFLSGYGGGIRFLLPYGIVARTEYAVNNLGRGQFILDFRTPF
ncbi:MAG TPA: BamA/TamA family outer membrane protein [Bacteroidota bacterium]|nr:BamA/TamA family outer membrane protein [Bacteroidota bacterium]